MPTSGDVVDLDRGIPTASEAGFRHPAVVVTAQAILDSQPKIVQVVPLTTTIRGFESEVVLEPDPHNGLTEPSAAQCQHVRAVATVRIEGVRGNAGPVALARIRDVLGLIFDLSR